MNRPDHANPAPPTGLQVNLKDHRLEPTAPIGQGSFGIVYRAVYKDGQDRAIKFFTGGRVDLGRIRRELERLRAVAQHPGIVDILDFDLTGPTPYFAMKLHADRVEDAGQGVRWRGRTLARLCGRVDRNEALRLLNEIVAAMAYLHEHDTAHCDLKPSNVLLTDESPPRVKLCDFGQSRSSQSTLLEASGTPVYAAPEQLENPIDDSGGRSLQWDVYGFGVVAYELATGRLPRLGELADHDASESSASADHGPVTLPTLSPGGSGIEIGDIVRRTRERGDTIAWPDDCVLPPEERTIIETCLRLDPSHRFPSMIGVRQALRDLADARELDRLRHEAELARQAQAAEAKRARVFRVAAVAVTVLAVAASIGFWHATRSERDAINQRQTAIRTLADARHQQAVEQVTGSEEIAALPYALNAHLLNPADPAAPTLLFSLLTHRVPSAPLHNPIALASEPASITSNRDHSMLLTTGLGLPMQVWSLEDGRKLAEIPVHSGELSHGGFTADGLGTFHHSDKDLTLRIWNQLPTAEPSASFAVPLALSFMPTDSKGSCIVAYTSSFMMDLPKLLGLPVEPNSSPLFIGGLPAWQSFITSGAEDAMLIDTSSHSNPLESIAISPNGKLAATADQSGRVVIWDLQQSSKNATIDLKNKITALQFHPDSHSLLAGTEVGVVASFDATTGDRLTEWRFSNYDSCLSAAHSGDGLCYGASSDESQGWVQLWDKGNGKRLFYHQVGREVQQLGISHNSDTLFALCQWGGFHMIDVRSQRHETSHHVGTFRVEKGAWDERRRQAWLLDESHTVRTYSTEISSETCIKLPHQGEGEMIRFSDDGKLLLVVASKPFLHQVWDVPTGLPLHPPVFHTAEITAAEFTADGGSVIAALRNGEVREWNAEDGNPKMLIQEGVAMGPCMSGASPNHRHLAQIRIDLSELFRKVTTLANAQGDPVTAIAQAGGIQAIRDTVRSSIQIIDLQKRERSGIVQLPGQYLNASVSDDGSKTLLLGSEKPGSAIQASLLINGVLTNRFPVSGFGSDEVRVSGSGHHALFGDGTKGAVLLGLSPVRKIAQLTHLQEITHAEFSSDGRLLATASADGTAKIWRCADGKPACTPLQCGDGESVYGVAFSPDGRWVATGGSDERVLLWETASGKRVSIDLMATDDIRDVEFSRDGRWLASCGDDGVVRIWECLTEEHAMPPPVSQDVVAMLAEAMLMPDGRLEPTLAWNRDDIVGRIQALPRGPWRAALENTLRPAFSRPITPSSTRTVGEDRLREAHCRLLLGDHHSAVHLVRMAIRNQSITAIPAALDSVRRLLAGEAVESTTIEQRSGVHLEGAGKVAGDKVENSIGMALRWCPPGKFMMGSPPGATDRGNNESWREVLLTRGFWIGESEVTQGDWGRVMKQTLRDLVQSALIVDTKYKFDATPGAPFRTIRELAGVESDADPESLIGIQDDDYPVYWVSRTQAVEFCTRLTESEHEAGRLAEGWEYRLPSEAEWEYACRAGATQAPAGGSAQGLGDMGGDADLDAIAWYSANSCHDYPKGERGWNCENWEGRAYPGTIAGPRRTRLKQPNPWGLHDMVGNLYEWTSCFDGDQLTVQRVNPERPSGGTMDWAIMRGGSWKNRASFCRPTLRALENRELRGEYLGFRVVRALKPSRE